MPGPRAVSMLLLAVVVAVLSGVEAAKCVCNLPKDPGPCKGSISKFYFNAKTGNCEHFFYGGCKGNKNRFNTRAKCEKRCKISTEIELICPVVPTETVGACAEMCPAGGCPKGKMCCSNGCGHTCKDPVPTIEASEHELLCNLPKDPGPCEAYIRMFYFNAKTGNCKEFFYGGCEGNKNRFDTKAECEKRCKNTNELCPVVPTGTFAHCAEMCPASGCPDGKICCSNGCGHTCQYPVDKPTKPMVHVCCLEEDPGRCKGYFPRYFYSKTENKCKEFIYGGCGGNGNNFKSLAECQKMCK